MKKTYVKTPTIFQMESSECGAASLAMLMGYYGKHIPLDQLRIDTGVSRDGCRASKILRGARKYGFATEGIRMGLEALIAHKAPCIIHWNFNHFVVYEGIKGSYAYINDPARGRRKLSIDELDEAFTGIVLVIKPDENFVKNKKESNLLDLIKHRLHGQEKVIGYLVVLGLFINFIAIIDPIFSQTFIDDILIGGRSDWLYVLIIAMLTATVLRSLFTYYRDALIVKLQMKCGLLFLYKFLMHLFRLPMSFFYGRYNGDITNRVDINDKVSEFLLGNLITTALNICTSVLFLAVLIFYNPILTLIGVACIVINMVVLKLVSEKITQSNMKLQQDQGKLTGVLFAGITMMPSLKAGGIENHYAERVIGISENCLAQAQGFGKLQKIANSIPTMLTELRNFLILIVGAVFVIQGTMSIGMLLAFNLILSMLNEPVNKLVEFAQKIQEMKADIARVHDIEKQQEDNVYTIEQSVSLEGKLSGKIELCEVSFGYSPLEPPLVENFSFKVMPGKSIAFFGSSGCGKSTVSKLVSGLYLPWSGKILTDGIDLNEIDAQIKGTSISTVSQEISLFAGSIRDNITMWNPLIRDEDVVRAAKDACIHDMITKKPNAYEYVLTEGGKNLSGGQRQRIEIARALAVNPSILVMDEATSALDPLVEKQIIDNIKKRGCTCIVVAHRLSAIRDCTEIIVMDHGKIAERGQHNDLIKQKGIYQKLISSV